MKRVFFHVDGKVLDLAKPKVAHVRDCGMATNCGCGRKVARDAKMSQEKAGYVAISPSRARHCGRCSMYSGDATSGTCSIVEGAVSEDGVCDHFEARV